MDDSADFGPVADADTVSSSAATFTSASKRSLALTTFDCI